MTEYFPHIVEQGEHLYRFALRWGFDPGVTWDHPSNAHLRKRKRSPGTLAPGDVLYFPRPKRKWLPVTVGQANTFAATVPTVPIELILEDEVGPIAGEPFVVLELPSKKDPRKTSDKGLVSLDVPVNMNAITVFLVERHETIPVLVGHLDPPDETSGVEHRLTNLGYRTGNSTLDGVEPWSGTLAKSLWHFQRDAGLTPTGECNPDTLAALIAAHGC